MVDEVPISERLTFRRMHRGDLGDMERLLGDPVVMQHYPHPFSRVEVTGWIDWQERNYARDGFGLWILHDAEGGFVGDCGLTWQEVDGVTDLEVGYHLVPSAQGRGLATEAAAACRDFAVGRGITRLIAIVATGNGPSRRVAERIGLVVERETTYQGLPVLMLSSSLPV